MGKDTIQVQTGPFATSDSEALCAAAIEQAQAQATQERTRIAQALERSHAQHDRPALERITAQGASAAQAGRLTLAEQIALAAALTNLSGVQS